MAVEPSVEEIIEQERSARDSEAHVYDRRSDRLSIQLQVLDACYAQVLGPGGGELAVDVGCGTGRHLPWLLERGGDVVGIDHSARSIELARARVGPQAEGRLRLEVGDVRELPVKDASADRVLCSEMIAHVPSAEIRSAAVGEMYRVLKPGGIAVISTPRWLGHVKTWRREGFWEGEHGRLYYHLLTAGELRRLLRAAGFEGVRVVRAAMPSLSKRLGVGINGQRRLAFMPVANLLGHFLVGYGRRPATAADRDRGG